MKPTYYPIALKLKGKAAIVVGGGQVAERKVKTLLDFGARVRVISPQLTIGLQKFFMSRRIAWVMRGVRLSDIEKADIVIAATDNKDVNEKVSRWARKKDIWINVVDKPALSNFISPAVFFAEEGIVAVYSDGKDPVLSRDLKNFIKEKWNEFLSYRHRLQDNAR